MARFKKISYFLEYALIRFLGIFLNLLPFPFVLRLARPVSALLFRFFKRSQRIAIALDNLRRAYGSEKSESEIQKIALESFIGLLEFGMEWLRMPQIAGDPGRYLGIRHVDRIHAALHRKKGALLLVSHNGNWEIMALIAGLWIAKPVQVPIYALARPLKNPYLYRYILRLRGLTGLRSIDRAGGVRETFARLRENSIVSLLVDQRVSEGSVEAEFFGQEALTTALPAIAALRLGTPVFFVFVRRTPELRYVMEVEGPLPIEMTGNPKRDVQTNTQRFNDRLEAEIRKDPSRWLWMHNRWRLEYEPKH